MKSLIFNFVAAALTAFPVAISAQTVSDSVQKETAMMQKEVTNKSEMERIIDRSISKVKQEEPETALTCIAEMERITAIYPDSVAPKMHIAQQCLSYAICQPQAKQAGEMIEKARQAIAAIEKMPAADVSDLCMLRGFLYTTIIVQDPMKNGPQYYRDVIENFEKALKVNPDNKLARELYERFKEGIRGVH